MIESYADVEALVRKEVDRLAGSSLSIAVVHEDEIVYTYAYGQANPVAGIPADTQTIYQYGSMTKVVTATALMQLVEQGQVDLDAWPGEYIPEFPESWNVTVRQLLDHSACLPDERPPDKWTDRLTRGILCPLRRDLHRLRQGLSRSGVRARQGLCITPTHLSWRWRASSKRSAENPMIPM